MHSGVILISILVSISRIWSDGARKANGRGVVGGGVFVCEFQITIVLFRHTILHAGSPIVRVAAIPSIAAASSFAASSFAASIFTASIATSSLLLSHLASPSVLEIIIAGVAGGLRSEYGAM